MTYMLCRSPAASPSPKLRKLQNPMRGSYNEALHLAGHSSPAGDRRVSQSLDFSRPEARISLSLVDLGSKNAGCLQYRQSAKCSCHTALPHIAQVACPALFKHAAQHPNIQPTCCLNCTDNHPAECLAFADASHILT